MTRVMIADDHEPMQGMVRKLLGGQMGFSVVAEACDGAEALRIAEDFAPDLVSMDVQMSGIDGFEVVAKMLKIRPTLGIVMASMDYNAEYPRIAVELDAIGFVKKRDLDATPLLDMLKGQTSRES